MLSLSDYKPMDGIASGMSLGSKVILYGGFPFHVLMGFFYAFYYYAQRLDKETGGKP